MMRPHPFKLKLVAFAYHSRANAEGGIKVSKQESSLQKQRRGERKYGVDDIVTNNRSLHTLK
ncbi:TPA: hypothetical protein I7769_16050 [Vibrio vulnificus]|nr:hypothetical protein [Vibrio vulnificus]